MAPCISICDRFHFLKNGQINSIMFLKRFFFFDKKVCTNILATKTYGIDEFYDILKNDITIFRIEYIARRKAHC